MGLLKHLLFWPVTGPTFLTRFSLEQVEGAVRTELTDDSPIKRDLMELQMQLDLGEIDDDEYVVREAELMMRLRDVRRWREDLGMATAGGLVQVSREADHAETEGGEEEQASAAPDARTPRVARSDQAEVDVSLGFDEG